MLDDRVLLLGVDPADSVHSLQRQHDAAVDRVGATGQAGTQRVLRSWVGDRRLRGSSGA